MDDHIKGVREMYFFFTHLFGQIVSLFYGTLLVIFEIKEIVRYTFYSL